MKYINHKGQIIIIISLFFAVAILAVAVLAYMALSKTQSLSYYPYKEIVESISTDFHNALTNILAITTQIYNQTAEIDSPRRNASQLFTFWYQAVQRTYSSKGLNINTSFDMVRLQPSKNIWSMSLPELYVYNLTKLYWYAPQAISAIEASLYINSAQYQFYGWKTRILIFLNITIQLPTIKNDGKRVSFNLIVLSEKGPVSDLTNSSVVVWYFDPTVATNVFPWKKANVTLSYFGNGNYSVTFVPNLYKSDNRFWSYYYKFILVQVKDSRGIIAEAYSYSEIEYTINENAVPSTYSNDLRKQDETYLFEVLPNGTIYWFDQPLRIPSGTYPPPIPIPPVKQIRVYTTRYSQNDFVEAPYQVELWSSNYSLPTLKFAEWRRRILAGSKIVFLVNYPPGIKEQKVRISWVYDCDSSPPKYRINMTYYKDFADISNGKYTLRLVAKPSSYELDWTISLIDKNGRHTEYTLFGYNVLKYPDGYWYPKELPWGNWTVIAGPVRAIAFRNSTQVYYTFYNYKTGKLDHTVVNNELLHTMLISVPYNVSYFTWTFRGTWLKDITLNYSSYIGMINGNSSDVGTLNRVSWGSVYSSKYNIIINGSFSNSSNVEHRSATINDATYGYWLTMYNSYFGSSIFASNDLIAALQSDNYDQAWVWTTGDYYRRVMEYDSIYPLATTVQKKAGSSFYVRAAGMIHEGGSVSGWFYNYKTWANGYQYSRSTGVDISLMYYGMFSGGSNPSISNVQVIYTPSF